MAEGILYNLAANIMTQLDSLPVEEIKLLTGVPTEITKLESTVSTIRAVLLDAQERQFRSHEVKDWLMKLEDVMYDLDDLLDSVSTEKLWREAMTREKSHIFRSSSNQLLFRHKTGKKIISIRDKLEAIAKDRAQFHFNEHLIEDSARQRERTLTESFVREEDVIGRDDDKEVILNFLLNPDVEENVAVKCICGLGGLGKTTLAQSVYNDERVKNHFKDIQKWVCVSNDFNVTSIAKAILGSESNGHEVKTKLAEQLKEKRYIIVLDDVWNDDRAKWLDLKTLLDYGARGSKVIVTAQEEKVARVCGDTYRILSLTPDRSWAMFCKFAFTGGKEPTEKNLIKTAKEIVRKCRGVPLAIRVLGSMLFGIRSEQWSTFLNSELSSIDQLRDSIMPILQVSYDNLPSHLKNCFAYCALFPQDHLYDMNQVVDFWIAQGFILSSNGSFKDSGYIYCEELIERSLFQRVETDIREYNSKWFKMHDLMHDLASSVSGMMHHEESHRNVRHYRGDAWHNSLESTKLRSFVYQKYSIELPIDLRSVCEATSLRVLDLSYACAWKVPKRIGKLKHLRYLNLSRTQIRKLPKSICRLQNLRTLILDSCEYLRALPRGLTKLVNLRHLFMRDMRGYDLPSGLGKVTCLENLPTVYPSQKQGIFNLGELNELNRLKDLDISCVMLKTQSHLEAEDANLEGKWYMRRLVLSYVNNDMMLEAFRPHEILKELEVDFFDGVINVPNWLTTLTNLASIHLSNSDTCKYLPPLHQLPALKSLKLCDLPALEYVADDKELPSLSSSFFPSLEKLHLCLLTMKAWWKRQAIEDGIDHNAASTSMPQNNIRHQHLLYQFPHLSQLVIENCPDLTSIPASQVQITYLSLYLVNETLEYSLMEQ